MGTPEPQISRTLMDQPTHSDLLREQNGFARRQADFETSIARVGEQLHNLAEKMDLRHEHSVEMRKVTDSKIEDVRVSHIKAYEAIMQVIQDHGKDVDEAKEIARSSLALHAKETGAELRDISVKMWTLGGGISVIVFILTVFAPVIQRQFDPEDNPVEPPVAPPSNLSYHETLQDYPKPGTR